MSQMDEIKNLLEQQLQDSIVAVNDLTGTQDHLGILVAWEGFDGQALIQQHQQIMDILKPLLKEKVHAVKIKTMTKTKYLEKQ